MAEGEKKRRVKNPETFRERALKASESEEKPDRKRRLGDASSKAISPVAKPVGDFGKKVFNRQPFKFIGKVLGKILLPTYVRLSWQELKLVTWPKWRESLRLTRAVLIFAVIFGITIAAVDYGLEKVFKQILIK